MKHYDVVVVGGGFAGVGAAVAAARHGAKTLLVEQSGALGGAASNNLVMPFMNYRTRVNGKVINLCDGIFIEILTRMKEACQMDKYGTMYFHTEYLKRIMDELTSDAGVDVLFHTTFVNAHVENGRINSMFFVCRGNTYEFSADVFIDTTGDGNVSASCGAPFRVGRESDGLCQPMTTCFRVGNVDVKRFYKEDNKSLNTLYNQFQVEGKIKNLRDDVLIFRYPAKGVLHFNSTRVIKLSPIDAFDISRAEREAREQVFELFDFMVQNVPSFKDAELISIAPSIGTRESRMIDGEYVLTGEDLLALTVFDDAIAAGNYDIDIHSPDGGGTEHHFFKEGTYYTIPYRSLLPKGLDNLLVAGRCISCDHEAQASIRIMPIVCCLGQAAGTAAALSAKGGVGVKALDTALLQKTLKDNGCFIG